MSKWFRCKHKKTSLPVVRPRRDPDSNRLTNTYVVCLGCREQLPYSFEESQIVPERRQAGAPEEGWIAIPSGRFTSS